MTPYRIAHLADLHLNVGNGNEAFECFEYGLKKAVEMGCSTIIIAGDIWDHTPDLWAVLRLQNILKQYEPGEIVMVYGDHDLRPALEVLGLPVESVYHVPGSIFAIPKGTTDLSMACVLSFLPYPTKGHLMTWAEGGILETDNIGTDLIRQIVRGFAVDYQEITKSHVSMTGIPHILIGHGNIVGAEMARGHVMTGGDIMISAHELEESGADYIAFGHIHKCQALSARVHYSGSTWNTDYGETDKKFMLVVDVVRGEEPKGEAVVLPTRKGAAK